MFTNAERELLGEILARKYIDLNQLIAQDKSCDQPPSILCSVYKEQAEVIGKIQLWLHSGRDTFSLEQKDFIRAILSDIKPAQNHKRMVSSIRQKLEYL